MAPPALTLDADHIAWSSEGYEATGAPLTATWGDVRLTALRIARSGDELRAETGTIERGGATLAFATATFGLTGGDARLATVGYLPASSCLAPDAESLPLTAAGVTVPRDGPWVVEGATVRPCACVAGPSLLAFSARSAEVVPDDHAVLHGGWVRILGAPVVPVPWWRVALDPAAFRLRFPEIGYGGPGWSVGLAGSGGIRGGPLDGWRLTGGPAWRQDRGFRVGMEARGAPGGLEGELAWDTVEQEARGALVGEGGIAGPRGDALAWDLDLASDRTYADDYGASWVARGVGWRDSIASAAWGPASLLGRVADDGSSLRVLALGEGARLERSRWGVGAGGELGLVGSSTVGDPAAGAPLLADAGIRLAASGDAHAARTWGALHLEARAAGTAFTYGGAALGGWARADGRVEVPVWTEGRRGGRVQWWPGALVDAGGSGGDARVPEDQLPSLASYTESGAARLSDLPSGVRLWAGPTLRGQAAGAHLVAEGELRVGADPSGFAPSLRLSLADGPRSVRVYADQEEQGGEARVRLGDDPVSVTPRVGAWHRDDVTGVWGGLDGRYRRLTYGAGLAVDAGEGEVTGGDARIGYDDGCAQVGVRGAFAPDRAIPDLALVLALRR